MSFAENVMFTYYMREIGVKGQIQKHMVLMFVDHVNGETGYLMTMQLK